MGKAEDIEAWGQFCEMIEDNSKRDRDAGGGGSYFEDLVHVREKVEQNIRDDHGPFLGIYEIEAVATELRKDLEDLREELAEAQEWDVRNLIRQRTQNDRELITANAEVKQLDRARSQISARLNWTPENEEESDETTG